MMVSYRRTVVYRWDWRHSDGRAANSPDFGGFPQALYDTHYPAWIACAGAASTVELLAPVPVALR